MQIILGVWRTASACKIDAHGIDGFGGFQSCGGRTCMFAVCRVQGGRSAAPVGDYEQCGKAPWLALARAGVEGAALYGCAAGARARAGEALARAGAVGLA